MKFFFFFFFFREKRIALDLSIKLVFHDRVGENFEFEGIVGI